MMIYPYKLIYSLLLLMMYFLPSFAQNEVVVLKKLAQKADVILIGKVVKKESGWNASKTRIFTKTTIKAEEYIKGTYNENLLEVVYPGGEIDGVGEIYTHMPKFEDNEEALIFLKKDKKKKTYKVLSGEIGKIKILTDNKSDEKITSSNLQLEALKKQIKSYIKR